MKNILFLTIIVLSTSAYAESETLKGSSQFLNQPIQKTTVESTELCDDNEGTSPMDLVLQDLSSQYPGWVKLVKSSGGLGCQWSKTYEISIYSQLQIDLMRSDEFIDQVLKNGINKSYYKSEDEDTKASIQKSILQYKQKMAEIKSTL